MLPTSYWSSSWPWLWYTLYSQVSLCVSQYVSTCCRYCTCCCRVFAGTTAVRQCRELASMPWIKLAVMSACKGSSRYALPCPACVAFPCSASIVLLLVLSALLCSAGLSCTPLPCSFCPDVPSPVNSNKVFFIQQQDHAVPCRLVFNGCRDRVDWMCGMLLPTPS